MQDVSQKAKVHAPFASMKSTHSVSDVSLTLLESILASGKQKESKF
jgi:hypothetical protein